MLAYGRRRDGERDTVTTISSLTYEDLGSEAQRDRRRRILEAARRLATEGGFEAVQMRAVAQRADVALGTLYRYFPSKIHLLVSVLALQLERANATLERRPVPEGTAADRVVHVLERATRSLQREPLLTEALTRAFMFADASVTSEIADVAREVTRLLTRAMHGTAARCVRASPEDAAVVKVIGDVWLASLVQWVTGRASAADVTHSLDVAVRLLLR